MSTSDNKQLLGIGKQCSHSQCNLVDFLPFKCQHCQDYFCQEHFKVSGHNCPKYDESKHNRVAPNCPMCNTPVAVRLGQDPNIRMEEHFEKECSAMTGRKGKTKTMPVCAKSNCKKVLFSPIRCNSCSDHFCPAHRFPRDHNCSPTAASPAKTRFSRLLELHTKGASPMRLSTKAASLGAQDSSRASAPLRSTSASQPSLSEPKVATASSSLSNPFSKVNNLSLLRFDTSH